MPPTATCGRRRSGVPRLSVAFGLLLALSLGSGKASAQARCNTAPAGSTSAYGNAGLLSLARSEPRSIERMKEPRLWLSAGLSLLRMPYQWAAPTVRAHLLPAKWLWAEGAFGYGLPAQEDLGPRHGSWASARLGVRVWTRSAEAPWRFVLSACRSSNYMPSRWEDRDPGGGLPSNETPEPTRLDYVRVDVPVQHGVWLDGGLRWGWLAYRPCEGGTCDSDPAQAAAVLTWAAGVRYARFTAARLDDGPLRAHFEVWAHALFRPRGLPDGPLEVDGPVLPDAQSSARREAGVEVGTRYTPWAFEWAQIELAVGYTPAAGDLIAEAGVSFPLWLL